MPDKKVEDATPSSDEKRYILEQLTKASQPKGRHHTN